MTPFITTGVRTSAISATAVISASGLLATPASAEPAHAANAPGEAPLHTSQLAVASASLDAAFVPAASPVILSIAAPAKAVKTASHVTHTVVRGDTVWDLARHYRSTVSAIVDANDLDKRATIHVGTKLVIPTTTGSADAKVASSRASKHAPGHSVTRTHTVKAGDTVWDLASHYGSTVNAIVKANGLGVHAVIHVGDRLTIPGAKASAPAKATTTSGTKKPATASSRYTVKRGDTLSAIARKFGTTVNKIAGANGIDDPSQIHVGQKLTIPGGVPTGLVGDTFAGRTYARDVVRGANANKQILNHTSVPTRAQVRALVEKTAKKHGVNVALALAIAYQESGFNQRAVSPANAVGVMQVIPSTGTWVSSMVGRDLDLLHAQDNVTAGVVLLMYLTRNADNLDQAIAGYYQGLGGVRKHGMNPDTKRYVKSVRALMKKFD